MISFRVAIVAAFVTLSCVASAATPEQQKAFADTYRKAWEGKDAKTLHSLLYAKGADPEALKFYRMAMIDGMGGKVDSIKIESLTAEDTTRVNTNRPGADGKMLKLGLVPTLKLVLSVEKKYPGGTSTSTSSVYLAEHEGKLVIPVPVPVK